MFNLENIKPSSIRLLEEMKDLVYDQEWLKKANPKTELYYVWRDMAENEQDKEKISQNGLGYDLTQFAPLILGKECNKTFGHTHSLVPGTNSAYPEIYEVLEGQVQFLFQKFNNDQIEDIFTVNCQPGDKFIVKPGYAHFSINPTNQKTLMANWEATASQHDYKEIKRLKGAGYYALKPASQRGESEKGIEWIKNPNYSSIPELRTEEPNNLSQFDIPQDQSTYKLVDNLTKLDFLKNPQNYEWK